MRCLKACGLSGPRGFESRPRRQTLRTTFKFFVARAKFLPQVIKTEAQDMHMYLHVEGGDGLKFGDVVMAVATIAVISAVIGFPLDLVFVSAFGFKYGQDVGVFVSFFLSALIGGYIFAGKIWEARRETITKITVLWAALVTLIVTMVPAGVAHWGLMAEEEFQLMFPGATEPSTAAEWVSYEMIYNASLMFLIVGIALVLGFIGLYVGSMLRRPAKSGK
jgi:hypothetical protein